MPRFKTQHEQRRRKQQSAAVDDNGSHLRDGRGGDPDYQSGCLGGFGLILTLIKLRKYKTMNKAKILGIIRHVLGFAGGIAVGKGLLDEGTSQEIIGSSMTLISVIWSFLAPEKSEQS
jgi:hypothetical protein